MRWHELGGQACPVARTASLIGERWTLLILRDAFLGVRRFEDFQASLGVTRHVLAGRLRKLVGAGVLRRAAYQERPRRYEYRLTDKGRALYPVLLAVIHWGETQTPAPGGPIIVRRHKRCGAPLAPAMVCAACGETIDPREVAVEAGPGASS